MKKALKITGSVLFYGILVVLIVAVFMFARSTDENKSIFGYRFYEVLSGSMRPTIDIGELVVVKMVDPEDVQVGDIVTKSVSDDGSLTLTHRVIEIFTDENGVKMVRTQGDNNVDPDEPMPIINVIGTLETHIPYAGYVVGFLKDNFLYVLFVAASLIVLFTVLRIILRKDEPEKLEDQQTPEMLEQQASELIELAEDLLGQAQALRMKNLRQYDGYPYQGIDRNGGFEYSNAENTNAGFSYRTAETVSRNQMLGQMPYGSAQAMSQVPESMASHVSYRIPNQPSSQIGAYTPRSTPKGVDRTMMSETQYSTRVKGGQVGRPVVPLK